MAAQPQGNQKQPDPNGFMPPAVRRAAEEADRLMREQQAPPPDAPQEPAQRPQDGPKPTNPSPPPPRQEAAPEPAREEPAGTQQGNEDPTWEQRFKSEQGRTRKLQNDMAAMATRQQDLERLLASVQAATPAQSSQPSEMQFEKLLTPEEEAEWGEALPVIEKKAREIVAPLQSQLEERIRQLDERLGNMGQAQIQDAKSKMLQMLDTHQTIGAEGQRYWRDVNTDPEFVEWLQQVDRRSGRVFIDMLKDAFNSNDAARVAAFFEDWLKEPVAQQTAPQTAPSQGTQQGKPSLETFAAPGRAPRSAAPASGPADKPTFTSGDISRFYADLTNGRWKGREDEAKRYELAIVEAGREGRVRPGPPQP